MSDFIANFHFLRPLWLFGLIPLFAVFQFWDRISIRNSQWSDFVDARLLTALSLSQSEAVKASRLPRYIFLSAALLSVVAMAGPVWEKLPQPVFKAEQARVFVLDLSRSMDAPDVAPTRLSRAKLKLLDMLRASKEGQSALVVFAQSAYVVSPLTDDAQTIASLIPPLSTDIVPVQGDNTRAGVRKAVELLRQAQLSRGDIILIGDDQNLDAGDIEAVRDAGYRLNVLAVGTENGAPIQTSDSGFLKDSQGAILLPRLDIVSMRSMAREGGGRFSLLSIDDNDIKSLLARDIGSNREFSAAKDERKTDQWHEAGPWLLIPVLVLVLFAMRRGWLLSLFMLCFIMPYDEAAAKNISDYFLNQDQRAKVEFDKGNFERAAGEFSDQGWKGAAYYRAGKYAQAQESFAGLDEVTALYNKANSLAQLKQFEQAIETYEQVLQRDAKHEDARFNLELLKKLLESRSDSSSDQNQEGDEGAEQQQQQSSESGDNDGSEQQSEQSADQQGKQDKEKGRSSEKANEQQAAQANEHSESQESSNSDNKQQPQAMKESGQDDSGEQKDGSDTSAMVSEEDQAMEQWLRRIPDDPGGLLRQKFLLQHRLQNSGQDSRTEQNK